MTKKTSEALRLLALHHHEFIAAARALYGNDSRVKNYAEDYVQEAYLKLSKYDNLYQRIINEKGKATKGYMFFCLRSIILNDFKKVRTPKFQFIGTQYDIAERLLMNPAFENLFEDSIDPYIEAITKIEDKIYKILKEKLEWFDFELFRVYMTSGKSSRTLAKETGLGVQTIYLSLKKSKALLAEYLDEDYLDLINGDYSKIKK